jgi:bifunctional DNA-binding transcriptional regulator/antitoxin component of YhaV-PrlF toxin-antitoxin module
MKDAIAEFWTTPDKNRYIVPVDEEGVLTFPDELMDKMDWQPGDILEWIDNKDGSFSLKKQN